MGLGSKSSFAGGSGSGSCRKLQSGCRPGLQSSQSSPRGRSACRLTPMGLSTGPPALQRGTHERPRGEPLRHESWSSYNPVSEVTSHCFRCILRETQATCFGLFSGQGIIVQRCEYQGVGILGDYPSHCLPQGVPTLPQARRRMLLLCS